MARWHRYDARAKMLIYAHECKELPPQFYRANLSQPVRPVRPSPMLRRNAPVRADTHPMQDELLRGSNFATPFEEMPQRL
jgi:hypothetical protein